MDENKEWHWLTGGIVVSLLSIGTYIIFEALSYKNYPFGITAGYGFIVAKFKYIFSELNQNPVIKKFSESPAALVEIFMLIGIALGGYTASKLGKSYSPENIPAVWTKYHGTKAWKRIIVVLLGGFTLGLGSVFASGCTTGNILQGWAHLSLGSIVAGICFFIGGIITAKLLYPKTGGEK